MRSLMGWPRWALVAVVAVSRRTGLASGLLWRAERELWVREVIEILDEEEAATAHRCAPVPRVQ